MAKVEAKRGRGRPSLTETPAKRHGVLVAIRDTIVDQMPSRTVIMKLIEAGFVEATTAPLTGRKGRPTVVYQLSGKGRSFVALMERNLKRP